MFCFSSQRPLYQQPHSLPTIGSRDSSSHQESFEYGHSSTTDFPLNSSVSPDIHAGKQQTNGSFQGAKHKISVSKLNFDEIENGTYYQGAEHNKGNSKLGNSIGESTADIINAARKSVNVNDSSNWAPVQSSKQNSISLPNVRKSKSGNGGNLASMIDADHGVYSGAPALQVSYRVKGAPNSVESPGKILFLLKFGDVVILLK